jgi:hypothetical protein
MTTKHYDVVVLGRSIGALSAAALLARRTFTVLVLGQGERRANYAWGTRTLRRRAFTMLAATSPCWRRIVVELAQSQAWKRMVVPVAPMLQVLGPRTRLEVPPDMDLFVREIERELPDLRRVVEEAYADFARVNGAADEAFDADAVWPPGNFWERRETGKRAAMLPYLLAEPDADLLVDVPRAHVFRDIVDASVRFASDLASPPPPFAVARLHGAWTRGLVALRDGEEELERFLVDRIEAQGGTCRLNERATSLMLRGGAVAGVVADGQDEPIGATFLVTDVDGERLANLAGGQGISKRALREWPRIGVSAGRFVVSMIARTEGIPRPLGVETLLLPSPSQDPEAIPAVHLQRTAGNPGETLLVAETLLSGRSPLAMHEARAAVLAAVKRELPFLERHLVAVDSPHDGLPLWSYVDGHRRLVERSALTGASLAPEPLTPLLDVDPPGYLGLAGEPVRGPIERTFLVGRSVLPAIGQEGQLLAAWSAARMITRTDRRKERMRRDMWNRIEIG